MAKPGPKERPLDDPVAEAKRLRRLEQRRATYYRNHEAEKEKRRIKSAERRASGHSRYESEKTHYLQYRYGITVEDYDRMVVAQDGKCAACGVYRLDQRKYRFDIDHDHVTGKVRGLLCPNCNRALGMLDDSPERAMALAAYLMSHEDALGLQKVEG